MNDEQAPGGLHIDADWKDEAAQEKQRLIEQERRERVETIDTAAGAPSLFLELVNLLAMQAAVSLGGVQGSGPEAIPANPVAAKHFIDLMEVLEKKTEGNLTEEEKQILSSVSHELRMQYVQLASSPPPADPAPTDPAPTGA